MKRSRITILRPMGAMTVMLFCLAAMALAQGAIDYGRDASWLCRPGRHDACDVDLTTTVVDGDGHFTVERWQADPAAPIDCFYVYPTVSTDPGANSDLTADAAELNVARQQFARFGSKCRLYAPLYRQITLAGLRPMLAGGLESNPFARGVQYDDVRSAWNWYLEHDNAGRGFVLVGHSQGSFILQELIRREIDGKPVQERMVSAILPGATLAVGTFSRVPLCMASGQAGCVITYASFRSTSGAPPNTLFGKATAGVAAGCTNPAALGGGDGPLRSYLSTPGRTIVGTTTPKPWVLPERAIDTPWVSAPGLLTARCTSNSNATYLEITVHGDPADPRTDDIIGDLTAGGRVLPEWGLHLVDMDIAIGNLVDLVGQQSRAWLSSRK